MNRRSFIKTAGAGAAVAASALAAPAIAQPMPAIKWRCQSSWSPALDVMYGTAPRFAARVAAATEGRFQIEVVPAGDKQIVAPFAVADAVAQGEIDMCQTASYYFIDKDPAFAFGTAIPFGLDARQFNAWMYHGGGDELLNAVYARFGLYGLLSGNTGAQMGGWYRNEIKTLADLAGLRMRISGLAGQVMARLGVETRQLSGKATIDALASGEIGAAEWVGPYDDERLGLNKLARYYYYPGFWEGAAGVHYFINLEKWSELPPSYQAVVQAAAANSNNWMLSRYDAVNAPALKRLIDQGAELRQFPTEILDAAYQAALAVFAQNSARSADFKKIYDHLTAFRREMLRWFEVAERSFDDYVYARAERE